MKAWWIVFAVAFLQVASCSDPSVKLPSDLATREGAVPTLVEPTPPEQIWCFRNCTPYEQGGAVYSDLLFMQSLKPGEVISANEPLLVGAAGHTARAGCGESLLVLPGNLELIRTGSTVATLANLSASQLVVRGYEDFPTEVASLSPSSQACYPGPAVLRVGRSVKEIRGGTFCQLLGEAEPETGVAIDCGGALLQAVARICGQ